MTSRRGRPLDDIAARRVGPVDFATLAFVGLSGAAAAKIFIVGRGLNFFYDEWSFVLYRRGHGLDTFLEPHNGHLSLIPVVMYKLLFEFVGLEHYGPYRLTVIALHVACAYLLFLLLRRRVGPTLALVSVAPVLFLGTAWQDLLWPFQVGYLASIAGGLAALLAIERGSDRVASAALAVSLASSGLGVPFAAGVFVALLLAHAPARRFWVVAIPTGAYALWYLVYGESQASLSNVPLLPRYVFDSFAGALGQGTGLGLEKGRLLATLAVVAAVSVAVRRRMWRAALPPLIVVLSFWSLTALSRGQLGEPAASRYIYPGVVLLLLVAAGLLTGVRLAAPLVALIAVGVVLVCAANLRTLDAGAGGLRETGAYVAAELSALELVRGMVLDNFRPDSVRAPQVTAGAYFKAVDDLGSASLPVRQLPFQSQGVRAEVDAIIVNAIRGAVVSRRDPVIANTTPIVEGHRLGSIGRIGSCITFTPRPGFAQASFDVVVPEHGVIVRSGRPARIFIRRFGDSYRGPAVATIAPGTSTIDPPEDESAMPWRARIMPVVSAVLCDNR